MFATHTLKNALVRLGSAGVVSVPVGLLPQLDDSPLNIARFRVRIPAPEPSDVSRHSGRVSSRGVAADQQAVNAISHRRPNEQADPVSETSLRPVPAVLQTAAADWYSTWSPGTAQLPRFDKPHVAQPSRAGRVSLRLVLPLVDEHSFRLPTIRSRPRDDRYAANTTAHRPGKDRSRASSTRPGSPLQSRGVFPIAAPSRSGCVAREAGGDESSGIGRHPVQADARIALNVLSGRGAGDGSRPGVD